MTPNKDELLEIAKEKYKKGTSRTERLTESTVPEVGKFYLVPCADYREPDGKLIGYVPVIGNEHKDAQFGVNEKHYHVDGRFIRSNNVLRLDENGKTNSILFSGGNKTYNYVDRITLKRKKCVRATTGIKPPWHASRYHQWKESMIGKSCKGKRCPHLGTIMHELNGELVCPLHDLRGCPEKQVITH